MKIQRFSYNMRIASKSLRRGFILTLLIYILSGVIYINCIHKCASLQVRINKLFFTLKETSEKKPYIFLNCVFFSQFWETESYQFTVKEKGFRLSSMGQNPYYATYYVFWSKLFLMELIPYGLITILNGFIIAKIYSSYKFRKQFIVRRASSPGEQQRKYSSIPVIQEEDNLDLVDGN